MASPPAPVPAQPHKPTSVVIPSELVPERAGTVAFVGSQNRTGDWLLPRLFRVVAFMGNVEIDLTRARVGPGVSHIEVRSIMGNVEIKAPPEIRIECDGSAVMGNFESHAKAEHTDLANAPVVRVSGVALFGNVEVHVVDPNAKSWFERLTSGLG
jgi:hypothetical protein